MAETPENLLAHTESLSLDRPLGEPQIKIEPEQLTVINDNVRPIEGLLRGATNRDNDQRREGGSDEAAALVLRPEMCDANNASTSDENNDVRSLELKVHRAKQVLARIEDVLAVEAPEIRDAEHWRVQVQELRNRDLQKPAVIGVVGNTGAGKSSVINAVLDEQRLVPTSCVRACTAAVTEISWNYSENPDERYRAIIEFVTAQDWEHELKVLFGDLVTSSGELSSDCTNPDSEAGIAYAKIKSVYPHLTRSTIAEQSVESLMRQQSVQNILGQKINIQEARPVAFYKRLKTYVDSTGVVSQARAESSRTSTSNPVGRTMKYWPLIRVVKLYTRSDVLSTGAVIVDLPGVQDSNAARAAVAETYMKQCTGLWIVAPITRAVDDKVARDLLGQQFKRQLKLDGLYSRVTFICSKTDDISVTEAIENLDVGEQLQEFQDQADDLRNKITELEDEQASLSAMEEENNEKKEAIVSRLEQWGKLKMKITIGQTVYAPRERKRKRPADDDDDDFNPNLQRGVQSAPGTAIEAPQVPLTIDQIQNELDRLAAQSATVDAEQLKTTIQLRTNDKQLQKAGAEQRALTTDMHQLCVRARNEYAKTAIRQDFAAGVKELDQEQAIETQEEQFDPEEDLRDYAEVAESLSVFCVSSRAYQWLSGRLPNDSSIVGFTRKSSTEVPALQKHCKKITEAGRAAACSSWLNSCDGLLNSLTLWAESSELSVEPIRAKARAVLLQERMRNLEKDLRDNFDDFIQTASLNFRRHIYAFCGPAIRKARSDSPTTATKWGDYPAEGGIHHATYKATVRRGGVFSGTRGLRNLNYELAAPMLDRLSTGWEKVFQRCIPSALKDFVNKAMLAVEEFHGLIERHAQDHEATDATLSRLANQLNTHPQKFQELADQVQAVITDQQRDTNRLFESVVKAHMVDVYDACSRESGTYARMKFAMQNHVERQKHLMFGAAVQDVKRHLEEICNCVREKTDPKMQTILDSIKGDYMAALGERSDSENLEAVRRLKLEVGSQVAASRGMLGHAVDASQTLSDAMPSQEEGRHQLMEDVE